MLSSKSKTKPKPKFTESLATQFSFEAIGTIWHITLYRTLNKALSQELIALIKQRIEEFDYNYSRFRSDSLISKMAQHQGKYRLPDDAQPLFNLYRQLYDLTEGLMTPLIGQLMSDAGYDANYSFQSKSLNITPSWDSVLDYESPYLFVKQPALLDLGAAGKGHLVDIIAELLECAGITDFCINAGGDILQRCLKLNDPILVGLEHPNELDEVVGIVRLKNQSLCGSAGNRRAWQNFHHIINPKTQSSPTNLKATWVVANTTLLADGLATALFFTEASKLSQSYNFEYALINEDYSLEYSSNFPAEFFTEEHKEK